LLSHLSSESGCDDDGCYCGSGCGFDCAGGSFGFLLHPSQATPWPHHHSPFKSHVENQSLKNVKLGKNQGGIVEIRGTKAMDLEARAEVEASALKSFLEQVRAVSHFAQLRRK